jgi:hypothetical protein
MTRVPFQLADAANAHTNDPERFRGEVVDLDVSDDGLWITARLTEAGEHVLADNPMLGVSARIVEDYARSDGRHFPAAIQHVLGTLDPRIPQLGPWQVIEAANSGHRVIELTGCDWSGLSPEPWEVAAADQAVAEADAEDLLAPGSPLWDDLTDDEIDSLFQAHGGSGDLSGQPVTAIGLTGTAAATQAPAGLSAAGLRVYKKLISMGFPPVRALAFARNSQRGTANLSGEQAMAINLASYMEQQGNLGDAAELYQASGNYAAVERMIGLATEREQVRMSQDQAETGRRGSPEIRLANALARIGNGTYVQGSPLVDLGSTSQAARELAARRWRNADPAAAVTPGAPCGHIDDTGRCGARYHDAGCSALADQETAQALISSGTYARIATLPASPAGTGTLADHVEALTGQRIRRDGLFETGQGPRPLFAPERRRVVGDPDDPAPYPDLIPAASAKAAAAVIAQDGRLARRPSASQRRIAALTTRMAGASRLPQPADIARARRPGHPDYGESTRERNERLHRPVTLVQAGDPDDGLHGAQPAYRLG